MKIVFSVVWFHEGSINIEQEFCVLGSLKIWIINELIQTCIWSHFDFIKNLVSCWSCIQNCSCWFGLSYTNKCLCFCSTCTLNFSNWSLCIGPIDLDCSSDSLCFFHFFTCFSLLLDNLSFSQSIFSISKKINTQDLEANYIGKLFLKCCVYSFLQSITRFLTIFPENCIVEFSNSISYCLLDKWFIFSFIWCLILEIKFHDVFFLKFILQSETNSDCLTTSIIDFNWSSSWSSECGKVHIDLMGWENNEVASPSYKIPPTGFHSCSLINFLWKLAFNYTVLNWFNCASSYNYNNHNRDQ